MFSDTFMFSRQFGPRNAQGADVLESFVSQQNRTRSLLTIGTSITSGLETFTVDHLSNVSSSSSAGGSSAAQSVERRIAIASLAACLGISVCALCAFASEGEPVFHAEAEIERGTEVSRVSIFLVNRTKRDLQVGTGAITGGGVVIDGQAGGGSGIFPPKLRFSLDTDKLVELCVPNRTGGIGHSQRMQEYLARGGARQLYYSFFVANCYLTGEYLGGTLDIEWNRLRVPLIISRVIDQGPLLTNLLTEAANPTTPVRANTDLQHANPPPKYFPTFFGEVLVRRGDFVSEMEIWFVSEAKDSLDFLLYIPLGQQKVLPGTRDSEPPWVDFNSAFGSYSIAPPRVKERTVEDDQDRRIQLDPGERRLLHRFQVPTLYLAGGKGFEFGAIPTNRGIIPIRVAKLAGPRDSAQKPNN